MEETTPAFPTNENIDSPTEFDWMPTEQQRWMLASGDQPVDYDAKNWKWRDVVIDRDLS